MHYNRRERRRLAKALGLYGTAMDTVKDAEGNDINKTRPENDKEAKERRSRGRIAGDQIHSAFLQKVENDLRAADTKKDEEVFANLAKSVGEERAKEIVKNNLEVERKRLEKKIKKEMRRKGLEG
jgi:hypothetical protein